jgi:hypothetical protein
MCKNQEGNNISTTSFLSGSQWQPRWKSGFGFMPLSKCGTGTTVQIVVDLKQQSKSLSAIFLPGFRNKTVYVLI